MVLNSTNAVLIVLKVSDCSKVLCPAKMTHLGIAVFLVLKPNVLAIIRKKLILLGFLIGLVLKIEGHNEIENLVVKLERSSIHPSNN